MNTPGAVLHHRLGLILPVLPRVANSLIGSVAGGVGVVALVAVGTSVIDSPPG